MEILTIQLQRLALLGAARHKTHRFVVADADIVRAGKSAAHQEPGARGFDIRIISCPHRHREIQIAIFQNRRAPSIPALHHIGHALLANVGNEKSAVKEDRVGLGVFVRAQERCQMARNGGIGNIRQAQLAKQAALFFRRLVVDVAERQEAFECQLQSFFARDLGLERATHQRRSRAQHRDLHALQIRIRQHAFLGRRALTPQSGALAYRELRAELRLHQPGERQIQIVATEQQVFANRGASKLDAVAIAIHSDQREVAGAAADVAHQHQLAVEKALLRLRQVIGDPGIKRRRGLFHQRELLDPRGMRGLHGQLARLFVERGRDRQHDVLRRQRCIGMRLIPGIANRR